MICLRSKTVLKHGGGSGMAWACIAASETDSLISIDDVTHNDGSRMNSEVYWNILSSNYREMHKI